MNLQRALKQVLKHEGGYVNHPRDPGGETNYGITKRVAVDHGYVGSLKDIPMSTVEYIYRVSYWDKVRADLLPAELRYHVFDAAVNSGVSRAVKWLQECAGVEVDGVIGLKTIEAAKSVSPAKYNGVRLKYLTSLDGWNDFGRGWARRIADNLTLE